MLIKVIHATVEQNAFYSKQQQPASKDAQQLLSVMRNNVLLKELKYKRSPLFIKKKNENNYIGNESKKKAGERTLSLKIW